MVKLRNCFWQQPQQAYNLSFNEVLEMHSPGNFSSTPTFGQILEEIGADSEKIRAEQKQKNPSKNIKIRMHAMLYTFAHCVLNRNKPSIQIYQV